MDVQGLWVDDERPLPKQYEDAGGWVVARTYQEAIDLLSQHHFKQVSLDHDLGTFDENGREFTGYDVALWIANRVQQGQDGPDNVFAHSANPVGASRINGVAQRYINK